ncbi:Flp family type IVb pilin [Sulfobacillus thermosulfidooxidans]|uniref:Flp family type IVb pilin n=1 Tax=Sulfobacillus thermosulfidooxidans TaxID=28034 RepID=UPI0009E922B0|nr:Flp family type IVb pilin [Sulfobacillus thermosulfidooxidans]
MAKLQVFLLALFSRVKEKDGQALVEYALILALIAVVVIVALHFLGSSVKHQLNNIANNITNAS